MICEQCEDSEDETEYDLDANVLTEATNNELVPKEFITKDWCHPSVHEFENKHEKVVPVATYADSAAETPMLAESAITVPIGIGKG